MSARSNLKIADKKKHNFLFHGNQQTGGSMNQQGEVLRGDQ